MDKIVNLKNATYVLGEISVNELFRDPEGKFSIAIVEIDGNNGEFQHTKCESRYTVLEGEGRFVIGGEAVYVKVGDEVRIPVGTPYSDSGKMKLLVVNMPAFDPESVISYPLNDGSEQ